MKQIIQNTVSKWIRDDAITDSAAIAFYFLLSLPALLLFSVSLSSIFLKSKNIQDLIFNNLHGVVDDNIIIMIAALFEHLPQTNSLSLTTLMSFVVLLWTASSVFKQLQKFIDKSWKTKYNKTGRINNYLRNTVVSSLVVITFGFLLVVSIIADSIVYVISSVFDGILPFSTKLANYSTSVASFITLLIFFVFVYRVLSNRNMNYQYVFIGSLVTVTLITIGKYIVRLYLMYTDLLSVYGAIGSVIGLLFLIFYSTIVMTLSIEFVNAYVESKKVN